MTVSTTPVAMTSRMNRPVFRSRTVWIGCGAVVVLFAWQGISTAFPEVLLPSIFETLAALQAMVESGELFQQLRTTAVRIGIGWTLGSVAGIIVGLVAGPVKQLYHALHPLQALLTGAPPIMLVVIAMIWFGSGGAVPILTVMLVIAPIVYANTAEGWNSLDPKLVQMARVYDKSPGDIARHVILPGLAVPIITGLSVSAGFAVRIGIMAELLAANSGIGYSVALARVNINTAKVFAWMLISILLVALVDLVIIHPLKRWALRWQGEE